MTRKDVLPESLCVQLLRLDVVARESFLGVRNEDAAIRSSLQGAEDASASGSARESNIEVALERSSLLAIDLDSLGQIVLAVRLLDSLEVLVKPELAESAASNQ